MELIALGSLALLARSMQNRVDPDAVKSPSLNRTARLEGTPGSRFLHQAAPAGMWEILDHDGGKKQSGEKEHLWQTTFGSLRYAEHGVWDAMENSIPRARRPVGPKRPSGNQCTPEVVKLARGGPKAPARTRHARLVA